MLWGIYASAKWALIFFSDNGLSPCHPTNQCRNFVSWTREEKIEWNTICSSENTEDNTTWTMCGICEGFFVPNVCRLAYFIAWRMADWLDPYSIWYGVYQQHVRKHLKLYNCDVRMWNFTWEQNWSAEFSASSKRTPVECLYCFWCYILLKI